MYIDTVPLLGPRTAYSRTPAATKQKFKEVKLFKGTPEVSIELPKQHAYDELGIPMPVGRGGLCAVTVHGGPAECPVTLSFSGRLLEDLVVKPSIERFGDSGVEAAAAQIGGVGNIGGGFSRSLDMDFDLAEVIASIHLSLGFSTQSS